MSPIAPTRRSIRSRRLPVNSGGCASTAIAAGTLLSLLAPSARADFFLHFWENQYRPSHVYTVIPEVSRAVTTTNFDTTGGLAAPSNFVEYTRLQTDVLAAFGINSRLTVFGRAAWANVNLDAAGGGRSFGLTDQSLGATFRLFENSGSRSPSQHGEGLGLDLQFQADMPAYSNSSLAAAGLPFRGDGSIDMTSGAFITYGFGKQRTHLWKAMAGAGYTYRSGGFSASVPWSVTLRYSRLHEGMFFAASALGTQSLQTDTAQGTRGTIGAGGSFIVNAINPSHITGRAEIGYQVNPQLSLSVRGFQTFTGVSAPKVQSFSLAVQYYLQNPNSTSDPTRLSGSEYGRSNQGLVNYTFEGLVARVNDKLNLVKLDKGSQDGVEAGQIYDIFSVKKDGSIVEAVARARCQSVTANEAVLNVVEYYREVWIEEGFIVKRPLQ